MDIGELLFILVQGFLIGAGPCLIICAPVIIPYIAGTQDSWQEGIRSTLIFSCTRLAVYVLLGAVSGYVGSWLIKLFISTQFSLWLWTFGGGMIIAIGLLVVFVDKIDSPLCRHLSKNYVKDPIANMIILGLIVGLSPCLPLIGIMAEIAIIAKNPLVGALFGLAFGIGTVISPLLLFGALAPVLPSGLIKSEKGKKVLRTVCGALMIVVGAYILLSRLIMVSF